MTDNPVPQTLGDAGKFKELVEEIARQLRQGEPAQDANAVLRSNYSRLTVRLLFDGDDTGEALSKEYTPDELRNTSVNALAAEFVATYRRKGQRRRSR